MQRYTHSLLIGFLGLVSLAVECEPPKSYITPDPERDRENFLQIMIPSLARNHYVSEMRVVDETICQIQAVALEHARDPIDDPVAPRLKDTCAFVPVEITTFEVVDPINNAAVTVGQTIRTISSFSTNPASADQRIGNQSLTPGDQGIYMYGPAYQESQPIPTDCGISFDHYDAYFWYNYGGLTKEELIAEIMKYQPNVRLQGNVDVLKSFLDTDLCYDYGE